MIGKSRGGKLIILKYQFKVKTHLFKKLSLSENETH